MIGIIPHVLVRLAEKHGGEAFVEKLFQEAKLSTPIDFQIDRNYLDEDVRALIVCAKRLLEPLGTDVDAVYAAEFLQKAEQLFPQFFRMSKNARDFLRRQPAIHNSIGRGLKDKRERENVSRKFQVSDGTDGDLQVIYDSPNRLCSLYCALAKQTGYRYGETVEVHMDHCGKRSGGACRMTVHFQGQEVAA